MPGVIDLEIGRNIRGGGRITEGLCVHFAGQSHLQKERTEMANLTASQRIRRIEEISKTPEPQYPKIGEPLGNYSMKGKKDFKTNYQPHIIESERVGLFLNLGFDSESSALEYSAEIVLKSRTNQRLLGII